MKRGIVLSMFLLVVMLVLVTITVPKAYSKTTDITVKLSGTKIGQAGLAVADFDDDGDLEIIAGGTDGMLYVLAYDGTNWSVVWSRQTAIDLNAAGAPTTCENTAQSDITSAPAVADLDNDGRLEIVVTTGGDPGRTATNDAHRNGGTLVYHYNNKWNFSVVTGWPQPKADVIGRGSGASNPDGCWDGSWGSPALGDVDGDGDLEIAVVGFDRRFHLWHHNGSYVSGWPIDGQNDGIHRSGWSSPALADIDGNDNGRLEIVIASDDFPSDGMPPYYFYVFNDDSTLVPGFPIKTPSDTFSSPAIGDINGDGSLDIVAGAGGQGDGEIVHAWDNHGNELPGWPQVTDGNMPASPALGDLDGDGKLDVVIGCGAEGDPSPAPCQKLYAFHGDGTNVAGFPMIPENNLPWGDTTANGLPYTPILADYDGDGSVEILVLNRWSWGISTVESDGRSNNNPAFVTQSTLASSPVVADVDNDGLLEILIGGMNSSGQGMVYIWDVGGSVNDVLPWPMFHNNIARTGLIAQPPELGELNNMMFFHQIGSTGATYTRTISLRNDGGGSFDWTATHSISQLQVMPLSGTVSHNGIITFVVSIDTGTVGLVTGWNNLGDVTITATDNSMAVSGSPQILSVNVFIGDIKSVYLPVVLK